jgi:chloride channel 3/4/5
MQGPIALSRNAPMELVFELFSKLGLRYLCIVDGGKYVGVVHKKMFLAYLRGLENQK